MKEFINKSKDLADLAVQSNGLLEECGGSDKEPLDEAETTVGQLVLSVRMTSRQTPHMSGTH